MYDRGVEERYGMLDTTAPSRPYDHISRMSWGWRSSKIGSYQELCCASTSLTSLKRLVEHGRGGGRVGVEKP